MQRTREQIILAQGYLSQKDTTVAAAVADAPMITWISWMNFVGF